MSCAFQPPSLPSTLMFLTFTLLLAHHCVTEGEQAEKLMGMQISHFHWFQQCVIIETEVWVCQGVEGSKVQFLRINESDESQELHELLLVCERLFKNNRCFEVTYL